MYLHAASLLASAIHQQQEQQQEQHRRGVLCVFMRIKSIARRLTTIFHSFSIKFCVFFRSLFLLFNFAVQSRRRGVVWN